MSQMSQFRRKVRRNFNLTASKEVAKSQLKPYKIYTRARDILAIFPYIIFYNNCDNCDNCENIRISTLFKVAIKKIIATNCDFPTPTTLFFV